MVKFSRKNNKAYKIVKEDIKELITRVEKVVYNLVSSI